MSDYDNGSTQGNGSKKDAFTMVPIWLSALVADPDSFISASHIMAWIAI